MLKPKPTQGDSSWFVHDRFGLFIHWGLYALPARHEWVKSHEEISDEDYQPYFDNFNPTLYDPKQWACTAREAGLKYVVITTKHHEGFCLWDSQYTDYKVTNTSYGKELIAPFVEAFRAEGLRIGFYYSLLDWHHPDFTIDVHHPLRNHPDAAELNKSRDLTRYAKYMRHQMRELLTNFGQIDELFCDFSYPDREYKGLPGKGRDDWESEKLVKLIRELQPKIMLNNRLDLPEAADFYTPEQIQPPAWIHVDGEPVVWETCQTFSGSWGYHRDEDTWKSPGQLIRMLVNTVSCGGNLLMNVGPTARGTWDQRALDALAVYRDWMTVNADSTYGCTQSEFIAPPDCRLTQNGNKLYVHVFAWPFKFLLLEGLAGKVKYAQFLHDGSEILMNAIPDWQLEQMQLKEDTLALTLPVKKPDVVVPVIELTLK
jgi:alpha-L-fucosidase